MHEHIPNFHNTEQWIIRQAVSSVRDQYSTEHNESTDVAECATTMRQVQPDPAAKACGGIERLTIYNIFF